MRRQAAEKEEYREQLKDEVRQRLATDLATASVADLKKVCCAADLAHKSGTKAQLLDRLQKWVDGKVKRKATELEKFIGLFDGGAKKRRR